MSYTNVYFAISGTENLSVFDMNTEIEDLYNYFDKDMKKVLTGAFVVFNPKLVFDEYGNGYSCESDFVNQIVLCDALFPNDIIRVTYAIVSYHHAGDPTDLEVVCEVGRILKELGYDLRRF